MKRTGWLTLLLALLLVTGCGKQGETGSSSAHGQEQSLAESSREEVKKSYTIDEAAAYNRNIREEEITLIGLDPQAFATEFAVLETPLGDITIALFGNQAPKTVENFIAHGEQGHFDGMPVHKAVSNFMIYSGLGTDSDRFLNLEGQAAVPEEEYSLDLWHLRGALTTLPGKDGSSEFAIVQAPYVNQATRKAMEQAVFPQKVQAAYRELGGVPGLDWNATVFGMVLPESLEMVDRIARLDTDEDGRPLEEVRIVSVRFLEHVEEAEEDLDSPAAE